MKQAEENPITPDTYRSRAEIGRRRKKQAEENPITPDTFGLTQGVRRILVKQAEENPITPDTALLIVPVPHDANEASRREPDHAGHVYGMGDEVVSFPKQAEENPITPDTGKSSFRMLTVRVRSKQKRTRSRRTPASRSLFSFGCCGSKQKRTRSRRTHNHG